MKPVAAIVEAAVNVDLLAERIIVALADERQAETSAARWEQQAAAARETAANRRREIGEMLCKARGAWPERGPNAKGWGDFLQRVGLEQSTAWRYMDDVRNPVSCSPHEKPDANGGDRDTKPANVHGGSGDKPRGAYCTPKKYADAVGPWDLDPFSNPHSHIVSTLRCMLEDGTDGFGDPNQPGSYFIGDGHPMQYATETTRTWWQPPYERGFLERVVAHYGHTRFCALLRWAPDTKWFAAMWPLVHTVAFPLERIPFETPDGVVLEGADDEDEDRGAPYPHAFYYADERDVTDAIRALCIVLRVEHPNT